MFLKKFKKLKLLLITVLAFSPLASFAQEVLTLQEALNIAVENNLQLKQGELRLQETEAGLTRTRVSRFPTLSGNLNHTYNYGRTLDPFTNEFVNQRAQSNYFSLNSGVTLFQGMQLYHRVKQSKESLEGGNYDLQDLRDDIRLNTISFYLNALMAGENVERLQSQVESTRQEYERTQKLVEAGRLNRTRDLEVKAQLSSEEAMLVEAQNDLEMGLLQLKQYLNIDPQQQLAVQKIELGEDVPEFAEVDINRVWQERLNELPEVQAAEHYVKSAEYGLKAAKAGRSPGLSLSGSLNTGYSSQRRDILPPFDISPFRNQINDNFGQTLGLSLFIPIVNNYQISYNVQLADINLQQAQLGFRQAELDMRNQVFEAYNTMKLSWKRYQAAENRYNSQVALREQSEARFREGLMNYYDWFIIENNTLSAQTELVQAKYQYVFASKQFDYFLGKPITIN